MSQKSNSGRNGGTHTIAVFFVRRAGKRPDGFPQDRGSEVGSRNVADGGGRFKVVDVGIR